MPTEQEIFAEMHSWRQLPVCENHADKLAVALMRDDLHGRSMHLMCAACAHDAERAGMVCYRQIFDGEVL